ncbi:MAG: hypothetical protein NC924_01830 [Candidatus Omnitrophica bacterium]|nr:hypothetical protein [Candidatus Omnitrophota bacterium]
MKSYRISLGLFALLLFFTATKTFALGEFDWSWQFENQQVSAYPTDSLHLSARLLITSFTNPAEINPASPVAQVFLNLPSYFSTASLFLTHVPEEYTFASGDTAGAFSGQLPVLTLNDFTNDLDGNGIADIFVDPDTGEERLVWSHPAISFVFGRLQPISGAVASSAIAARGSIGEYTPEFDNDPRHAMRITINNSTATPVPEPASFFLLLPALLGLLGITRRRAGQPVF